MPLLSLCHYMSELIMLLSGSREGAIHVALRINVLVPVESSRVDALAQWNWQENTHLFYGPFLSSCLRALTCPSSSHLWPFDISLRRMNISTALNEYKLSLSRSQFKRRIKENNDEQ